MNAPINYTFTGLNAGSTYYLQVEGTYGFANNEIFVDASYYIADQQVFNAEPNCRAKWQLNGSCQQQPVPFSYQPSHVYKFLLPAGSTQANISFHDCQIPPNFSCAYGDNAGSLTFKLFEQTNCVIPNFNPLPDTLYSLNGNITLDAGSGFQSYKWNNGSVSRQLTINSGGFYKVEVFNDAGCSAIDSVNVFILEARIIERDTIICKGSTVDLHTSVRFSGVSRDIDGNFYKTGSIGNQIWYLENLNVSKYRNGVSIPNITSSILWSADRNGAWCWLNNDSVTYSKYGKLYNWHSAVSLNSITPIGWRIPTFIEFKNLSNHLGGNSISGGKLKATGFADWAFPNTGATNESGFNGLPGAIRNYFGTFEPAFMKSGSFWSTNEIPTTYGIAMSLNYNIADVTFSGFGKETGINIRCIYNDTITYEWSGGETTSSIQINPTRDTTIVVKITAGGFSIYDTINIQILQVDTSVISLDNTSICLSSNAISRLQAASGMNSYQWLKDGVQISGATNRLFTATQTGNYRVVVRNSLGCQDTSGVYTITFFPPPTGVFQTPALTDICEGGYITLTASGAVSYQWFRNGIIILGAIAANYNAFLPGVYTVNFVSAQGCVAPSGKNITLGLLAKPEASFTYDSYCVGVLSNFNSTSTISNSGTVDLKWLFEDGTSQAGNSVVHNFPRAGAYTVKLVVTPLNCPLNADTVITTIPVQQAVAGIRYAPLNAVLNKTITINARSIGTNWLWLPAANLSDPRSRSPQLTPKQEQQYLVRISNSAGCVTTDSLLVRIFDERNIYVAGGFTPNNDGKNDRLYPIPVGIAEFRYLRIYNRWGNLVFETNSTDPLRGWDGTYKGKAQPSDTFTWIAEGVDVDGNIVKRTGSSILIR